jgi:hypothetical protein
MKKVIVILAAVIVTGCPSEARDRVLVARAADDFGCSEQEVQVIPSGGEQCAARGCGHKGSYICTPPKNPFAENYTCVPVPPLPALVPPGPAALPSAGPSATPITPSPTSSVKP